MAIERIQTGPRMSQIVIHNQTVYVAGQVASGAPGDTVAEQTKDILSRVDTLLASANTDKSKLLSATIWLTDMATFAEMNVVWRLGSYPGRRRRAPRLPLRTWRRRTSILRSQSSLLSLKRLDRGIPC